MLKLTRSFFTAGIPRAFVLSLVLVSMAGCSDLQYVFSSVQTRGQ